MGKHRDSLKLSLLIHFLHQTVISTVLPHFFIAQQSGTKTVAALFRASEVQNIGQVSSHLELFLSLLLLLLSELSSL